MVDRYTKAVLTVIAVSLAAIAVENMNAFPQARAQNYGPAHVIVDSVAPYAFQYAGPLTVKGQ